MEAREAYRNTGSLTIWPQLPPLAEWKDTFTTVHMWTQVVGKIRLTLAPFVNHSWGVTLHVTTRGLTTLPIPQGTRSFAIDFDFVDHSLRITTSEGDARSFALQPMSVADFFAKTMNALRELNIEVQIFTRPVEVVEAIRFEQDHQHASYDPRPAHLFWRAMVQAQRVFTEFRAQFIGKVSPVHFFWGGFDLAVTRFSGRTAPKHPGGVPNCANWVMEEAYSHEVSSAGFWPGVGLGGREEAAFYAYAYPQPAGFSDYAVLPREAFFHAQMGEFILPYEAVRTAADPDRALLSFLQSTYEAAALLAKWDRQALERPADPSLIPGRTRVAPR
ncbi:MAG TPA: DUF5996 family protein [Polyangiaceae bacterium]|jgi:hypothetical protein|nr:DUF5996 family protein [Polyangiaceae bacterium]